MAGQCGQSVTAFVRTAILAHLSREHARLYPDAPDPWAAARGEEPVRRVAEHGSGHG